jgi:hypothetical protein
MGFVLTILYLVTAYLGPETLFGPLAAAHIGIIFAVLAVIVSVPILSESFLGKTSQSIALAGLAVSVALSILFTGWITGSFKSFFDFIPNAFAYFLVCLHCTSKKRLQILVLMLLFVCLFVIAHGYFDLQHQLVADTTAQTDEGDSPDMVSDYLLAQKSDAGEWFYRIRGLDFINDPNDFAQVIVCVVPLVFIFWRPKRLVRNLFFVLVPVGVLLWGAFLTHSRGSVLAFLGMTIVAARRRIGTIPAALIAAVLFIGASALNFTGGRDISVDAGEGRTALWGESLELVKTHPLFGVGYGNLPGYIGHTAHNSIAVCAAELGIVGLYFWSLFLFPTVRDALVIGSPKQVTEAIPIDADAMPPPIVIGKVAGPAREQLSKNEINRLGRLMVLSLTGFLISGWFLSRAFTMTLFLLGGTAEVVFQIALQRGMVAPRLGLKPTLKYAVWFAISLLVLMNILLRTLNLSR